MPPSVFWPRPKVDSAIIQMIYDPRLRKRIPDLEFFHEFSRAIFFHRRKFLRSVLVSMLKDKLGKPEADAIMAKMGFNDQTRAETLSVDKLLKLCEIIRVQLPPEQRKFL